ncbi:MAG: glycoside hydrolase family 2 [Clostridia bacterium]|nr:glycoside hydrolase family 2 [Clostridia bacterium]
MKQDRFVTLDTPETGLAGNGAPVYPRPQLRRDSFFSLDGIWNFSAEPRGAKPDFDKRIRVPFPPESALSGIHHVYPDGTELCYHRKFELPDGFCRGRVLLHIGAADQVAKVWLNGHFLGKHKGGYLPFTFDVTEHLHAGKNALFIRVTDELDKHILPWGKQKHERGGMWYTPVSGIWQTVWLESVPETYVKALDIKADAEGASVRAEGVDEGMLLVTTPEGMTCVKMRGGVARVALDTPRLWSPEDPYLYRFKLICGEDTVESYFACRTLSVGKVKGVPRLLLNGKPYFFHGLLDQGYFPDGIFTPAHPCRYEKDILFAKSLGFNTLRKHIKIEPEQFYYDCDRLGMVVFQDMVNNGHYSFLRDTALPTVGLKKRNDKKLHRDPAAREAFLTAMEESVRHLGNHPCICYWTIFNEGWGQFDGDAVYRQLRALDDTRFIDTASGWFETKESDVESPHIYFKPIKCRPDKKPLVLSEFGGYSLAIDGHETCPGKAYGYRSFKDENAFCEALEELYRKEILPAARAGLSGAIYTQITDVEEEINGLLTYDRKHVKVDPANMQIIAKELMNAQK